MKNESRSLVAEGKHPKSQIFMPSIDTCHGHEALALEVSAKVSNGFRSLKDFNRAPSPLIVEPTDRTSCAVADMCECTLASLIRNVSKSDWHAFSLQTLCRICLFVATIRALS